MYVDKAAITVPRARCAFEHSARRGAVKQNFTMAAYKTVPKLSKRSRLIAEVTALPYKLQVAGTE